MQQAHAYRILIVEDDRVTAALTAELLRDQGHTAVIAHTPEAALEQIARSYYHLVIVDLRLRDNTDPNDRSGLELAEQIDQAIPKIILTKFPTLRDSVRALEQAAGRRSLAVKFVNKDDGDDVLSAAVAAVLDGAAPGASPPQIRWAERAAPGAPRSITAISDLIVGAVDASEMSARNREIADLLHQLFADYTRISVERLFPSGADWAALEVHTFRDEQDCGAYMVILGPKATLRAAEQRFAQLVGGHVVDGTLLADPPQETPRYAGLRLRVSGLRLERCVSLRDFYRANDTPALAAALESLYSVTLRSWYRRQIAPDRQRTVRYYQAWLSPPAQPAPLEQLRINCESIAAGLLRLQACQLSCSPQFIKIQWPDNSSTRLPFPAGAFNIERLLGSAQSLCGYVNGGVTLDSVLIDPQTRVCLLSDITRIEMGPLFIDLISLSVSLRSNLPESVSLAERFRVEEQLIGLPNLRSPISVEGGPEIQKFLALDGQLRRQAADLGIENDPRAYSLGLFFAAIRALLAYKPDHGYNNANRLWYGQMLLCAALLYQRLNSKAAVSSEDEPIHVDANRGAVQIGEHEYELTEQSFRIFCYLYERRGSVCSYQELLREIFGYKDIPSRHLSTLKDGLQTAVARLRTAIEDDLRPTGYIQNKRGRGYFFAPAESPIA